MNLNLAVNKFPTNDLWGIENFLPTIGVTETANYKKMQRYQLVGERIEILVTGSEYLYLTFPDWKIRWKLQRLNDNNEFDLFSRGILFLIPSEIRPQL